MLLMPALKISNPVEALIQMIIHDLARRTCLHLRVHILPIFILRSLFAACRMAYRIRKRGDRRDVFEAFCLEPW